MVAKRFSRPRASVAALLSFGVVAALVPVAIGAGTEERSVAAQAAPGTVTVRVYPEADTFVTEASPGGNFGGEEYVDVYGGRNPSCVLQSTPTYGLMRFDLSTIPAGAVLDARIVTTTRAGYAQDGDPNHHVLFLDDDAWTESGVTWATRPSDGTVAPGNPTMQVGGGDIRFSDRALGSAFVFRASCGADLAGNQSIVFPTTDGNELKPYEESREDLIGRLASERSGDGKLSVELYNPNCASCPGGTNLAYWARYWSTEAPDESVRPYLEVTISGGNDAWTRAEPIELDEGGAGVATGSIDVSGQARWYRFAIQPGTRAHVDLTDVPANYDVALFTDIAQAFNDVDDTGDLQQLSAEFAGDAFAPSVFSPSVFSPSVFSPSVFSPSVFSPSVFSPSVFSPSVFSPSVFSPSVFSPSVFSPSVFSPSVFSPSVFSDGQAYESAQVRSLIAVSANDGTADESLDVATWNNTGEFYVRVAGRNGAYSPLNPFGLLVSVDESACTGVEPSDAALLPAAPAAGGIRALVLADYGRMGGGLSQMQARLGTLAQTTTGRVVDVGTSPRVAALNAQADEYVDCPYAKNLVAEAIRDIVLAHRAVNPIDSVTVVGNDAVIPFFRYADASGLGPESGYVPPVAEGTASQASLRLNYFLSQDAYGSTTEVQLKGFALPVQDLPVGRLVETPAEITGVIDAFLTDPVLDPTRSLVTGYDFLADAATSVQATLSPGLAAADTLITNQDVDPTVTGNPPTASWTADHLRSALFGSDHDIIYLAGHFSANNLLAADYATTVNATEAVSSTVDLSNALVISAGCHSGYSVVDGHVVQNVTQPLDWVQAFARKRATVVAGTGYQYGDTDFLEYSERLYKNFAEALRMGTPGQAVGIGDALVAAKQRYLEETATIGGIHQKALLEATIYGLPMAAVNLPGARTGNPSSGPAVTPTPVPTDPGDTLGLSTYDLTTSPAIALQTKALTGPPNVTARWYTGPDGVVTNPGAPALPRDIINVTADGTVLRGVGFREGTFTDRSGVTPLTGAPATELNTPHSPFVSSAFFPSKLWTLNYFDGLQDGDTGTNLTLTPAQYRSEAPGSLTNVERAFSNVGLRLFYSNYAEHPNGDNNSAALAAAPTIARVDAGVAGSAVQFQVRAVGEVAAGMQQVWVTYAGAPAGRWRSFDLTQDPADSTLWTGALTPDAPVVPGGIQFIVQAVNGVGLVSLDDNQGELYRPGQIAPALQDPADLIATTLTLSGPGSAQYGTESTFTATLAAEGAGPLSGATVNFSIAGAEVTATTNASGVATVKVPALATPGDDSIVSAAFNGSTTHAASAASRPFVIAKLATALTLTSTSTGGPNTGLAATLKNSANVGIPDHTVFFTLAPAGGGTPITVSRVTGPIGTALLGTVTLPSGQPLLPGSYQVRAYFGPRAPDDYIPDDAIYLPSSAGPVTTVVGRPVVFASGRSGNGDIYSILPTDGGGELKQLTTGSAVDAEPEWSPNGERVVFTSNRSGNVELWVMNSDGSNPVKLTNNSATDTSPAWSPSGQKIAFASDRNGGNWDIYVMDVNNPAAAPQRFTNVSQRDLLPTWSPDGTKIAFTSTRSGNGDIYVMNATPNATQTKLTSSSGIDTEPAWSPNGTTIAFSTNRDGTANFEIYTMPAAGGTQTRRTNQAGLDGTPAWSSDGSHIAFASTRPPGGGINFNIFTMPMPATTQFPVAKILVNHASPDILPEW